MGKIERVKQVNITKLIPYENNAKTHSDEQIEKIAASIKEFGFLSPCLIDKDGNIIAGHGRVAAATSLGMSEIPCILIEGLTEEQRKAYILADNRLTEMGGRGANSGKGGKSGGGTSKGTKKSTSTKKTANARGLGGASNYSKALEKFVHRKPMM